MSGAMKPAIFNTKMVRAILDGRKTNTRRPFSKYIEKVIKYAQLLGEIGSNGVDRPFSNGDIKYLLEFSPYKVGDIIYVRETFIRGVEHDENDRALTTEDESDWIWKTYYRADNELINWVDSDGYEINTPWKPSIHMPKEYARLFLRVKNIRIERLNEISEKDCLREGIERLKSGRGFYDPTLSKAFVRFGCYLDTAKEAFQILWESIYGKNSFDDRWVWVIEFELIGKEEAMK